MYTTHPDCIGPLDKFSPSPPVTVHQSLNFVVVYNKKKVTGTSLFDGTTSLLESRPLYPPYILGSHRNRSFFNPRVRTSVLSGHPNLVLGHEVLPRVGFAMELKSDHPGTRLCRVDVVTLDWLRQQKFTDSDTTTQCAVIFYLCSRTMK